MSRFFKMLRLSKRVWAPNFLEPRHYSRKNAKQHSEKLETQSVFKLSRHDTAWVHNESNQNPKFTNEIKRKYTKSSPGSPSWWRTKDFEHKLLTAQADSGNAQNKRQTHGGLYVPGEATAENARSLSEGHVPDWQKPRRWPGFDNKNFAQVGDKERKMAKRLSIENSLVTSNFTHQKSQISGILTKTEDIPRIETPAVRPNMMFKKMVNPGMLRVE